MNFIAANEQISLTWELLLFFGLVGIIFWYGGHVVVRVPLWYYWGRKKEQSWSVIPRFVHIDCPEIEKWRGGVHSWLVGMVERLFFIIVIGTSGPGFGVGTMFAWFGIKIAVNWQSRYNAPEQDKRVLIRASQVSMFASLLSFLVALLGGLARISHT